MDKTLMYRATAQVDGEEHEGIFMILPHHNSKLFNYIDKVNQLHEVPAKNVRGIKLVERL